MNLDRARRFMEGLRIRDLKTGNMVPFIYNKNQQKAFKIIHNLEERKKPIWVVILKSRRVGMSSMFDGLGFCHVMAKPNRDGLILAHLLSSSKKLFQVPTSLWKSLPMKPGAIPTASRITFPHPQGNSILEIATAGREDIARGGTLSFLHLSEAAMYEREGTFSGVLSSVHYSTENIVVVESTANGMVGRGKAFYDMWCDAEAGRSDFAPIFLTWLDDPDCVRDEQEAESAPVDDEEKELLRRGATLRQLAWRRFAVRTFCEGYIDRFHAEYPTTPQESFISTGLPAFDQDEIRKAERTCVKPIQTGILEFKDGKYTLVEDYRGPLFLWEEPIPGHCYYIGGDAARGIESGDFAAAVVWNGTTGHQAARMSSKIAPEYMAFVLNLLGRWFNDAMINLELTGNLGLGCQRALRDTYQYPNIYGWKGKDDRRIQPTKRNVLGWETTERTRALALQLYRESLRNGELVVKDKILVAQMSAASTEEGIRWQVKKGHDDILYSALIGWAARVQYPPPDVVNKGWNLLEQWDALLQQSQKPGSHYSFPLEDPEARSAEHIKGVLHPRSKEPRLLEGI